MASSGRVADGWRVAAAKVTCQAGKYIKHLFDCQGHIVLIQKKTPARLVAPAGTLGEVAAKGLCHT